MSKTRHSSRLNRVVVRTVFSVTMLLAIDTNAIAQDAATSDLGFLQNAGQVVDFEGRSRTDVLFVSDGPGPTLFVRRGGISIVLARVGEHDTTPPQSFGDGVDWLGDDAIVAHRIGDLSQLPVSGQRVDLEFVGAELDGVTEMLDPTEDFVNIYSGSARAIEHHRRWQRLVLRDVWKDIDVVIRRSSAGLKYDFVVRSGASPSSIRLRYAGASSVALDDSGGIVIGTIFGVLQDAAPIVYQTRTKVGSPDTIPSRFVVEGEMVHFELDEYCHDVDLIVDPSLVWSTYYGGTLGDFAGFYSVGTQYVSNALTRDTAGNVYACGKTYSTNFPVSPGVFQTTPGQSPLNEDGWVVSFSKSGARRWATYVGGSGAETAGGIDIGPTDVLVFQGTTSSPNFPVTPSSFQQTRGSTYDAFMIRLSTTGTRIWASYLGGSGNDFGGYVAVDRDGSVVVTGTTLSSNFPVSPGAYRTTPSGQETYLLRFDAAGARRWGTFVGATNQEEAGGLDIDTNGTIGVAIRTTSTDFPTTIGTYRQGWTRTGAGDYEAVLATFDSSGNYRWGTYFGGNSNDVPRGMAFDGTGHIYLGGGTLSTNLPTTSASLQPFWTGLTPTYQDAFIARFTPSGAFGWCTYYGGPSQDYTSGVSAEWNGHVFVAGTASSAGVIRSGVSYDSVYGGGSDGFLLELDSTGGIVWDTYIGGTQIDYALAIVGDGAGSRFVAGYTSSSDFPVANPYQSSFAGGYDAFICRFCNTLYPPLEADGPLSFCDGDSVVLSGPSGFAAYRWWPTNDTTQSIIVDAAGRYAVTIIETTGCLGHSDTVGVVVHALPVPSIRVFGDTSICAGDSVLLTTYYPGARGYRWSTGSTNDSIYVKVAGSYAVEVTDSNGCRGLSPVRRIDVRPRPAPARITPSDTIRVCPDSMVAITIGSGYAVVQWSTGANAPTIRVGPGRYWARVSNAADCWNGSDTVTVVEHPRQRPTITAQGPRVFCRGDSVLLDAGAGFARYTWSTGDTGRFLVVHGAGAFRVTAIDTNGCIAQSDPIGVTEYAVPNPNIIPSRTLLCAGDSVILDATSPEFVHYQWNTGDTTPRIVVRTSGSYSVKVRSINGCEGSSTVIAIGVSPRPPVDIAGPSEICSGSRATYSTVARPGYRYEWSWTGNGTLIGGTSSASVTLTWGAPGVGSITVHVTDPATGCDSTVTIPVVIGSGLVPRIAAARLHVCPGDSVLLDAGVGYDEYLWSTGDTGRSVWGHAGVVYVVFVRNADGCSGSSLPITINESTGPRPEIVADGSLTFCEGDSVILDAGDYVRYQWNTGEVTRRVVVRTSGDYSVTVVDTVGCEGTSGTVRVLVNTIPAPTINGPTEVCHSSTSTYQSPEHAGSTYAWSVAGGTIVSGQGTREIVVRWGTTGGGRIDVTETSSSNCAGSAQPLAVTIGTQLRPVISPSGPQAFCPGDSITLDAGAGYASYEWSTGGRSRLVVVHLPGAYSVIVSDSSGCSGRSDTSTVTVLPSPVPNIRALGPLTFDEGDSVFLEVDTTFDEYRWSTGETGRRIVVAASGTYSVEVADSNGCRGTSPAISVAVIPRKPTPDTAEVHLWLGDHTGVPGVPVDIPIHMTSTKLATSGATRAIGQVRYNRTLLAPIGNTSSGWVDGGDRVIPFSVWLADSTGTGYLTHLAFLPALGNAVSTAMSLENVSFEGGAVRVSTDSGTFMVTGLCPDGGTRLVNTDGLFGVKSLQPNPSGTIIRIEFELIEDGPMKLELYDALGRCTQEVMRGPSVRGRYGAVINLAELPDGWYTLVLTSGVERTTELIRVVR